MQQPYNYVHFTACQIWVILLTSVWVHRCTWNNTAWTRHDNIPHNKDDVAHKNPTFTKQSPKRMGLLLQAKIVNTLLENKHLKL